MLRSPFASTALLFFGLCVTVLVPRAHGSDGTKTLIDFGDVRSDTEPNGSVTVIRVYDHAWGEWGNGVKDLRRKGTLIECAKNSGSLGENRTAVKFSGSPALLLNYVVGRHNRANHIAFKLTDSDGTEAEWNIPLEGRTPQILTAFRIDLAHPENQRGGKIPGLDLKRVTGWELTGDWSENHVEVLFVKLVTAQ